MHNLAYLFSLGWESLQWRTSARPPKRPSPTGCSWGASTATLGACRELTATSSALIVMIVHLRTL